MDYPRKLFLIQNCIYGVDIQAIAVQIAKLRCFISLIIDQREERSTVNRGILPLPNLETKFVAANTLIKVSDQMSLRSGDVEVKEKELKEVRQKHFTARTKRTKDKYRLRDRELRNAIGDLLKATGLEAALADTFSRWNPYDQNTSADFFDPEWMFGIADGFDIVIGNPPYIGHKGGAKEMFRKLKSTPLGKKFNNERMDMFYYFFHASINFANSKGVIVFITTNYYLTADSAIKLRKDLKKRTNLLKLINFNELKIFESAIGQHSIITFLTKNTEKQNCQIINVNREGIAGIELLEEILTGNDNSTIYYTQNNLNLYDGDKCYIRLLYSKISEQSDHETILGKIKSNNRLLAYYCNISQGIVTGIDKISPKHIIRHSEFEGNKGDGVFIISEQQKKSVGNSSLLKPWFKNSDISNYKVIETASKWLIHTSVHINLADFDNINSHLQKYKKLILERNFESGELSKAKHLNKWWALSSSRWEFDFDAPKIISPQRSYTNEFAYTENPWYASADVYFINQKDVSVSLKFILGVLNSKLIYFWLYNRGKRKGEMLELYLTPLSEIPIPTATEAEQKAIETLVQQCLEAKGQNIAQWEQEIDLLVAKLYGLSADEMAIIRGGKNE
jgi:adenine-specific DNA-methyltransferase